MGNSCFRNSIAPSKYSFVSGFSVHGSRVLQISSMRVLESKPGGATILLKMGKKKHKLRKQSKTENEPCNSDSSDEGGASAARGCPHIGKAINFNNVKKTLISP